MVAAGSAMDIPWPEQFDFKVKKWPTWKQRFLHFHEASDLVSKNGKRQVSMLLYCMGEKAEDIMQSFNCLMKMLRNSMLYLKSLTSILLSVAT